MTNSEKSGEGHSAQMVNPTILTHFSDCRIDPGESSPSLAKGFAHFLSFRTLSPANFTTDSVSFYPSEVIDLCGRAVEEFSVE